MAGLLGMLHTARSGMSTSQTSIQTTAHNINNMNTPGYSRQKVEQSAKSAYSYPGYNSSLGAGQLGTGVQATDVVRIRNTFYDFQFRSEAHSYGDISIRYDNYSNIETIFNEPSGTGISSTLNKFFNSWHELSKTPNDKGAKTIAIENAKHLANNITSITKKLENLKTNSEKGLDKNVEEINNMLNELKELDKHIKIIEGSGKSPNDLLDEKDRILDDLSFKLNIQDDDVKKLLDKGSVTLDDLIEKRRPDDKLITKLPELSGELKGSIDIINEIDGYISDLKNLAQGISNSVNNILSDGGTNPDNELFEIDGDGYIKVKQDMLDDYNKLDVTSDKALNLSNLKNEKITINREDTTINNYYNAIIQKVGDATQEIIRNEKNQSKILLNIDNSRMSVSGVSLDEEMVSLIQLQHAYNASAKVLSTIDSLLDVVINGLKR